VLALPPHDCRKPAGSLIAFGNASRAVPPIEPLTLMPKGSLHFTRPAIAHCIASRANLEQSAASVFGVLAPGVITPTTGRPPLADDTRSPMRQRRTAISKRAAPQGAIAFTL
jgi:NADPH:quinone reductase